MNGGHGFGGSGLYTFSYTLRSFVFDDFRQSPGVSWVSPGVSWGLLGGEKGGEGGTFNFLSDSNPRVGPCRPSVCGAPTVGPADGKGRMHD